MKVIFLDIDGVLVTGKFWHDGVTNGKFATPPRDVFGHLFDPDAVLNLKRIIDETGAVIVISSTWRADGHDRMVEMWKHRNLPGVILGVTPFINGKNRMRGDEIEFWLNINKMLFDVTNFVIVDDDSDMLSHQMDNFVRTTFQDGLTSEKANEIITILGKE